MTELTYLDDRVAIEAEDGSVASFAAFVDDGDTRFFPYTFTDPAHRGQGLAAKVTEPALKRGVEEGKDIVAVCPFVVTWLEEHPESGIEWRKATTDELAWLRENPVD